MKSFERSAFEACFEGVELQGKGRHRKPKIHQFFYARISIHGLQAPGKMGKFGPALHNQFDNIVTAQRALT